MTGREPTVASAAMDPQREAVYAAEEEAVADYFPELDDLTVERVEMFAAEALDRAGWRVEGSPKFDFDVSDDSGSSGWYEASTGVIHLHPRLLYADKVLHELAHWVDPRDGHGPRFCANHLLLVRAALGDDAADGLLWSYQEYGVTVDMEWLR